MKPQRRGIASTARPLALAEITFLAGRIEAVPDNKRELARSLIGQAMRRGTLSDKQLRAVAGLVASVKRTAREARAVA